MFALNQGEVCTCPSRALIQSSIYDEFLGDATARTEAIKQGNPLDTDTMIGAQASNDQLREDPVLHRHRQGRGRQGAHRRRAGRARRRPGRRVLRPADRSSRATTRCGSSRRRSSARSSSVTRFDDYDDAMKIANDTLYGLGAGRLVPRHQHGLPGRAGDPGRPGLDELLPRLPRARGVRRLQALRHRPGEPQDDARPLPADQEPAGQLQPLEARLLLSHGGRCDGRSGWRSRMRRRTGSAASPSMHGPLMFHQSGGCCDGSSPMCYPDGRVPHGVGGRASR